MKRLLLVLLLIAAGCSDGDSDGLRLDDAWARPSPTVATTAAFFVTIENSADVGKTLVRATTDACRVTELHMSSMTDGVTRMQQMADGIEIPALTTVVLQPGGLHIMCINKIADFAPDEELTVDLEFIDETGASRTESITAVVEDR